MKGAPLSRRDRLRHILADLRMPGALEALDAILHGVDGGTLTAPEAIEQLLAAQIQLRNNRRLQAAMRSSRLPVVKQLGDFDFTFQPSVRREQIESLHELGFVERRENVIFLGPPGVGKTHLAISLAIAAAQSGRRVYYGTLADLITSLEEAQAAGRLQARLKVLTHPALLVVDEIGYLPISRTGAMLFFQLMTRRYERASTVLTSNKGFEEWGDIFGDDVMAAALIDRLVHHCHLVTIRGNSYRMRQHTELWQTLQRRRIPNRPLGAGGLVRRRRRTEARPLVDLSDFHPAELSDFGPALTPSPNRCDSKPVRYSAAWRLVADREGVDRRVISTGIPTHRFAHLRRLQLWQRRRQPSSGPPEGYRLGATVTPVAFVDSARAPSVLWACNC